MAETNKYECNQSILEWMFLDTKEQEAISWRRIWFDDEQIWGTFCEWKGIGKQKSWLFYIRVYGVGEHWKHCKKNEIQIKYWTLIH